LRRFRSTHPYRHLGVDDATWKYISCGQGDDTLWLLTGGTGIAEGMMLALAALESEYRIVSPTYPPVTTIEQLVEGIMTILDSEGIHSVSVLGQSFGGMLAQVIVREYPERVDRLILSHTLTTSPLVDRAIILERQRRNERFLRMLPFLPFGMIRLVTRKRISRLISMMNTQDRGFWKAYFHEMLSCMTKEYLIANLKWESDFFQNYMFSENDLASWPGEILILESDNDVFIDPSQRQAIRELYQQARVHTFHGTGHLTIIVNREAFVSVVRDFLANDGGAIS